MRREHQLDFLSADFSSDTMAVRRKEDSIFKVLKENSIVNQESYTQQNYLSKNEGETDTPRLKKKNCC